MRKIALLLVAIVAACGAPPPVSAPSAPSSTATPTATPTEVALASPSTAPATAAPTATLTPTAAPTVAPVPRSTVAPLPASAVAPLPEQLRAYWVDAFGDGIYTAAQIDQLVASAKAANVNAIVAQVVRRGDCFCNNALTPRTEERIAAAPFDPLQTLIDRAHAEGIEVHAWVIVTGVWRGTTAPKDARHVFNTNGPSATGAAYWLMKRSDGADRLQAEGQEFFLDPGHPDAAAYMARMVTSIVERYAVDGVNLDRIRYPDGNIAGAPSWGYNPTALERFRAETGRTGVPAATDAQWTQWRRDRITDLVRRIYTDANAIRPGIRVSADTITYGEAPQGAGGWTRTRTYAEVLQDWVSWMRLGILDMNVPMAYKRDADATQRRQYAEWVAFAAEQRHGRHVAIGTALYLNEIEGSLRQVRTAVSAPDVGWVGYSYRSPDTLATAGTRSSAASRDLLTKALVAELFARPARVPAMPWKGR